MALIVEDAIMVPSHIADISVNMYASTSILNVWIYKGGYDAHPGPHLMIDADTMDLDAILKARTDMCACLAEIWSEHNAAEKAVTKLKADAEKLGFALVKKGEY